MLRGWVWLALLHTESLAGNIRQPVRVRGPPSVYLNSSKPVDTSWDGLPTTPPPPTRRASGTGVTLPANTPPTSLSDQAGCIDTVVTYTGQPPETVYVTVDGSYEVTVSATNVSITAPTIYETPQQACETTILPRISFDPFVGTSWAEFSAPNPPSASRSFRPDVPSPTPLTGKPKSESGRPPPPSAPPPPPPLVNKETSTIFVTKKTPVPVLPSITIQNPPVSFESPDTGFDQPTRGNPPPDAPSNNPGGGPSGNNPPQTPRPPNPTGGSGGSSGGGGGGGGGGGANPQPSAIQSAASGLASIIASVINSPFVIPSIPARPTPGFIAAPATPTIDGVAFTIRPSGIVAGAQSVALPTASPTALVVGSQTFVVRPSEIVGSGTTYKIEGQLATGATITQAPSVVTTAGITFTIGPTIAIIGGTTYRVGLGAASTTIVINGQTVTIGSDGVAFGGAMPTTYAPAMTLADGYEIVVVHGLTLSVDQTEAVISGATYRIGAGATLTTTVIGSNTITIGPEGVILSGTTIKPTVVPSVTASTTSSSRSTRTESATDSRGGSIQSSSDSVRSSVQVHFSLGIVVSLSLFFLGL